MALEPDYATLADLRKAVRITSGADTGDDWLLSLALTAASRAIDSATDRQFGSLSSAAARYYTASWDYNTNRWTVRIEDLMDASGLIVKFDLDDDGVYETTVTDYRLWPLDAPQNARPWDRIAFGPAVGLGLRPGNVEVTAKWGWTAVPSAINMACLLQAERFYKRRDSPFGVAGSPEMGNEMRLLAKLDPDVYVMVQPYRLFQMITTV